MAVGAGTPSTLTVTQWRDPLVDGRGHRVDSLYVEMFWLPVLGPSATFFLRRSAMFLNQTTTSFTFDLDWLGASLGLGRGESRNAPLPRAINRCVRFGVAKRTGPDRLAVRLVVATLPQHQVARLHPMTRQLHAGLHHKVMVT